MRWCTREAGRRDGKPPSGQMALVRPILQNPFPGHRRHQRRQGAFERRARQARSPRPDRRPAQFVLAGDRRRIRGAGAARAPRPRLRGAVALSGDSAKRRSARASQGTATIGAIVEAAAGGPPRQARSAPADASEPRSRLTAARQAGASPGCAPPSPPHRSIMLSGSSSSQVAAVSGCRVSHSALSQTAVASPPVVRLRRVGMGPNRLATWLKPGLCPQMRM
jgi:hypothetical protein